MPQPRLVEPDPAANHPSDPLMAFTLGLITSFLTTGSSADPDLARLVATETIMACDANGHTQLLAVAQIVGFALASLDNLRLSLDAGLPMSTKIRLRTSANALFRSSQRAAMVLRDQRDRAMPPGDESAEPAPSDSRANPVEAPRRAASVVGLPHPPYPDAPLPHSSLPEIPITPPFVAQPSVTQSSATQSSATQPSAAQPSVKQSSAARSSVTRSPGPDLQVSHAEPPAKPTAASRAVSSAAPAAVSPAASRAVSTGPALGSPLAASPSDEGRDPACDLSWAHAMTDVAAGYCAELAAIGPAQRRAHLARIDALTDTARTLSRGDVPLRSQLLTSVWQHA